VELFVRWAAAQDRLAPGDQEDLRICEDRSQPGVLRDDCESSEAWASPGVRVHWLATEQIRLDAAIENLIDDRYRVFGSGFDAPGMNASVAVTFNL
jgi:outer membrane receptor for ferrienterochelin and colicin